MSCSFDIKPGDRHCEFCTVIGCGERDGAQYDTAATTSALLHGHYENVCQSRGSSRAEQAAVERFPHGKFDGEQGDSLRAACIVGYHKAEKDLGWHSVKESLPPIEEEVIVLADDIHGKIVPNSKMICYGHRPNPNGWDGKSIETGKVTHYTPKTYNGWNIPGVKFWMPCPKLEEEQ